ncbi:hypothetical protein [Marinobacter sp.]|jgi:hypothetical protein|uniref:hypothetical protein n=1 Tax=Marinobacter sp. TaxID=50741 RepID=UPI00235595FF|nr:hypothetical protein [Marinobacter sp.]|tara:strand:- start:113 stop:418 length:306 start_codon:yes stop_codon:yes gene_type:complete
MGGTPTKLVKKAARSVSKALGGGGGSGGTPPTTKETREEIKDKFEAPKTTDPKDKEPDPRKLTRGRRSRRSRTLVGGQLAGGLTGVDYSPVRNPRGKSTLG